MRLFNKQYTKLIKGCKANERSAQEALFKAFYADMLRVCQRYLNTDELAAEALNTGFLKLFQNINEFDESKGEIGAWIRTIMVRTCIDLGRKEARFTVADHLDDYPDYAFISPEVLDKLYVEDVLQAIRRLPASTQLVFNLYVIDGYSHKEIAEQMQISDSTSRWHLTQAKKMLRELLIKDNNNSIDPPENSNKAS